MIVRAIAMKNASVTGTSCACTGAAQGTIVDLGGRSHGINLYAGLQVLSSTVDGVKAFLQANSSSGGGPAWADVGMFTSRACRDSQWRYVPFNCASATSTDRKFYRAGWSQTCTESPKWLLTAALSE